jgi:threonylcarbamoyladenosine tRNA methylthiotransferase MtaB
MIDNSTFENITALYHTFGCKLNFAETSSLARLFMENGVRRVTGDEVPDIIVINSCSVTEVADKKCRQTIRSFNRRYPDAAIVVTGCYAQLKSEEIAKLPGVAIVAGSDKKLEIVEFVKQWRQDRTKRTIVTASKDITTFMPSCSRGERTRFFLKVQDGCDYWCSYCTIPKARGRSRSGSIADIVEQARQAALQGGREIVITGVNIGDFGKGRDDNFFDLIKALDEVPGIERYRISSIEPNLLTDEIIEWCATSKHFMPHFHIPLQSGSDTVLKLMRRHYDTALFRRKIEKVRQVMPDAFIGVDLIVGARGETEECFEESRRFIESLDISRLHVFVYSERPGTRALEIEHAVDPAEKNRRAHVMLEISDQKLRQFTERFIGTERPALLEHPRAGHPMSGFTDNYLKIEIDAPQELDNHIVNVRLDSISDDNEHVKATLV